MSNAKSYDQHNNPGVVSDAESEQDLSRRVHEQHNRPASIDMALNLERELEDEHDEHDQEHMEASGRLNSATGEDNTDVQNSANRRISYDPHVLQHIIANLRAELSQAQQEREALAETLAGAPTREAELREALSLLTERCAALEAELEHLRKKSEDDDESINMLRTKLEESRRALMRLQTESKRMSQMSYMSVDTSRANSLFGGGPASSKRASFTPLTGSGAARMTSHRRISSVSEPSFVLDTGAEPASPTVAGRGISWPEEVDAKKARRSSAFFGGAPVSMALARSASPSPPTHQRALVSESSLDASFTAQELESLRKERDTARAELVAARQELAEAQEAREASEQCVAALRTFISAQSEDSSADAVGILKLPPLPTEKNADLDAAIEQTPSRKARPTMGAGWSFGKLFRADSAGSPSPPTEGSPAATRAAPGTPTPATATNASGSPGHSPSPSTATPGGAFTRTFGGFFSGRAPSITSLASVASPSNNANNNESPKTATKPVRPPTVHGQQEPTLNGLGSDEEGDDSVDEPLEPASPDPSSGGARSGSEIWVRNASSAGSEIGVADVASLASKNREDKAPLGTTQVEIGMAA